MVDSCHFLLSIKSTPGYWQTRQKENDTTKQKPQRRAEKRRQRGNGQCEEAEEVIGGMMCRRVGSWRSSDQESDFSLAAILI